MPGIGSVGGFSGTRKSKEVFFSFTSKWCIVPVSGGLHCHSAVVLAAVITSSFDTLIEPTSCMQVLHFKACELLCGRLKLAPDCAVTANSDLCSPMLCSAAQCCANYSCSCPARLADGNVVCLFVCFTYCNCPIGFTEPGATYRMDLAADQPQPELFRQTELSVPHNPADYETKQVQYECVCVTSKHSFTTAIPAFATISTATQGANSCASLGCTSTKGGCGVQSNCTAGPQTLGPPVLCRHTGVCSQQGRHQDPHVHHLQEGHQVGRQQPHTALWLR